MHYDSISNLPAFGPAARGLSSAVVGILLASAYMFGRKTLGSPLSLCIILFTFGSTVIFGIHALAIVVATAVLGVWLLSTRKAGVRLADRLVEIRAIRRGAYDRAP
jgi:chromate transport protein ChrA